MGHRFEAYNPKALPPYNPTLMTWLENIQNKPRAAKIKIMWAVSIIFAILLIIAWVISAHFHKGSSADTSIFKTIGDGVHNAKQNYGK